MKKLKTLYNFFKPVFKKYKWYFFSYVVLFSVGSTVANVIAPLYYKKIIDAATKQFSNMAFDFESLKILLFSLLLILVLAFVLRRLGGYILVLFYSRSRSEIHNYAFSKVLEKNYSFFSDNPSGSVTGKVDRLNKNFVSVLDVLFFGFFLLHLDIVLSSIILFRESKVLGLTMLSFFVFFSIFSVLVSRKKLRLDEKRAKLGTERFSTLSDIVSNSQNVLYFGSWFFEKRNYNEKVEKMRVAQLNAWLYGEKLSVIKNVLFIVFEFSILYLSLSLFVKGEITLGTLVLAQTYTTVFIIYSWSLSRSINSYVETLSNMKDAIEVIDSDQLEYSGDLKIFNSEKASVEFKNISFTYPKGEKVFDDFSLKISPGQSVGLVGISGSGKTTVTKLLLGLFPVDAGEILLSGKNLTEINKKYLRDYISYVPQESTLFHRSIKENIRYANTEAGDQEILSVAKSAYVDEFVQSFEEGYDTMVGERGIKLSGGQRQRVGIARAMLKSDAPLLIMDEATSALDSQSENYIQKSFEKLSKNRTTLVVAHRLSTIQNLDRIIVLDKGKIIQDGSHTELLKKGGAYAELWNSQSGGFLQD